MTKCRICGDLFRDGDDVVELDDEVVHHDCVEAPHEAPRRKVMKWGPLGSTNQLGMGAVQRGE